MRLSLAILAFSCSCLQADPPSSRSHPPLRSALPVGERPLSKGPGYFADASGGDDRNEGNQASPWRTIGHALKRLKAGDTLYLKGTFHETLHVALVGRPDQPITIRSAPGTQAILDGSFRLFFDQPADSWEPYPKGAPGEFRTKEPYPNLRTVIGSFGDSMIGLQTYFHAKDLRAENELLDWEDWARTAETDLKPVYCGPGLWYDPETGHIHIRLKHTNLPDPVPNYKGETDPRKLPLVIAPFHAVPLTIDHGRHLRFQDLIVRGAGYRTIVLDYAVDVEFDNVTVWCGTYGITANATGPFRFLRSALYGSAPPWNFRADSSKRDYPGRPHRNISRLNTHALLEIDSGRESSVFATPQNDHWEIAHSVFTDADDGLYLGGINVRFHHNLIENMRDDGLYLSPMYPRHRLEKKDPEIHIYQNVFRRMLTALAFGGSEPETRDQIYVYRNVFDLRPPVQTGRPSVKKAEPGFSSGKLIGDHGSPPWPALNFYHNTVFLKEPARDAAMDTFGGTKAGNPRRVFNNIFFHFARLPGFSGPNPAGNVIADGNLYWSVQGDMKGKDAFFKKFRGSELFVQSKKLYPAGSSTHCLLVDPLLLKVEADPARALDWRPGKESPAIDAGVPLPEGWPDPLRKLDPGRPDMGALPINVLHPSSFRVRPAPRLPLPKPVAATAESNCSTAPLPALPESPSTREPLPPTPKTLEPGAWPRRQSPG